MGRSGRARTRSNHASTQCGPVCLLSASNNPLAISRFNEAASDIKSLMYSLFNLRYRSMRYAGSTRQQGGSSMPACSDHWSSFHLRLRRIASAATCARLSGPTWSRHGGGLGPRARVVRTTCAPAGASRPDQWPSRCAGQSIGRGRPQSDAGHSGFGERAAWIT